MNTTVQRKRTLTPRARRILALLLLACLVLIPLIAIGVGAWYAHRYYDDVLTKNTRTLKSQTAVNGTRPKLTEAVEALRAKDAKRFFLKAGSAGLVAAEFQDSMKALIEASGARFTQSQPTPAKDVDGYRQIGANFTISGNQASLQKMLHAIEQKEPYVFVENLIFRSSGYGTRPAGQPEPEHYVQMDLISFAPLFADTPPPPATGNGAGKLGTVAPASGSPATATPAVPGASVVAPNTAPSATPNAASKPAPSAETLPIKQAPPVTTTPPASSAPNPTTTPPAAPNPPPPKPNGGKP
jgi:general secretion pathway protein M